MVVPDLSVSDTEVLFFCFLVGDPLAPQAQPESLIVKICSRSRWDRQGKYPNPRVVLNEAGLSEPGYKMAAKRTLGLWEMHESLSYYLYAPKHVPSCAHNPQRKACMSDLTREELLIILEKTVERQLLSDAELAPRKPPEPNDETGMVSLILLICESAKLEIF